MGPARLAGFIAALLITMSCYVSAESPSLNNSLNGNHVDDDISGIQSSFHPIVEMQDFIKLCGKHEKIIQNPGLQRVSKSWQRCYAYASGTIAAMKDIERTAIVKQFCVPANVSTEYAITLALKYARDIPETRKENPGKILLEVLAVRYPCKY